MSTAVMTKARCRAATITAIKNGAVIRMVVCEECTSSVNIECHHLDYSNPLAVKWLCHRCHMAAHGKTSHTIPNRFARKAEGLQRQISLTKTHDDKLTAIALSLGLTRSETIRRLIDLYQPPKREETREN